MSNATDNPSIEVLKAGGSGVFTNYIYKAIPLAFDESMSYYETLAGLRDYLEETVIPTVNNNAEAVAELQSLYEELNAYVDNYFTNLDVQEEINNKLDDLVADGTLTRLIGKYVQPLIDEQNQEIANFKTSVNAQIATQNAQISTQNAQIRAVTSGSPLVATSVSGMTDTTRVYVNTTDGNWYYYNGSAWTIGGVYQSTGIADYSIGLKQLKDEVIKDRYESSKKNFLNPFNCTNSKGITNGGIIEDSNNAWITHKINLLNGEEIRFFKKNESNNTSLIVTPRKIVVYDTNDNFLQFSAENKFIATQDCYVIVMFLQSSISYADRFKIQAKIFNSSNIYAEMGFPFERYTLNNKDNINLNVSFYELDNELKKKLPIIQNLKIEIGSILAANGSLYNNVFTRIRTAEFINMPKGSKIYTNEVSTCNFRIFFYNYTDDGYINYINRTEDITNYEFTDDSLVKIIFKDTNFPTVSEDDIDTIMEKYIILTPYENIQNKIKNFIPDTTGTEISYSGEKINLNNKCYFSSNIGIATLGQDGCIYNGLSFEFSSIGEFKVEDIETRTNYGTFTLDMQDTIKPHCNSACFGNEFYNENDEFPLLYVNAYNTADLPKGTCYVHRVQRDNNNQFTTTLVQTIQIGFTEDSLWAESTDIRPYGNFAVDTDNNFLYVFLMRESLNVTRFFKFNLPKLTDGNTVVLQQTDLIDYFDTPFQPYIQGCQYYQNKIYSSCGIDSLLANSSAIRVIDLVSKGEVSIIPTSSITVEPETIAFYNNKMVFGGSQLLYIDF